jgi:hypothetical protein
MIWLANLAVMQGGQTILIGIDQLRKGRHRSAGNTAKRGRTLVAQIVLHS